MTACPVQAYSVLEVKSISMLVALPLGYFKGRCKQSYVPQVHCMREGGIKEGGANEGSGAIIEHSVLIAR